MTVRLFGLVIFLWPDKTVIQVIIAYVGHGIKPDMLKPFSSQYKQLSYDLSK
jgi:hypothetical protein